MLLGVVLRKNLHFHGSDYLHLHDKEKVLIKGGPLGIMIAQRVRSYLKGKISQLFTSAKYR